PLFAETARSVTGVEPHPDLVALARRRTRRLPNVTVRQGTAQALTVPDSSVDVVHARWSYFFGPGCEPGLAELDRVVRRAGAARCEWSSTTTRPGPPSASGSGAATPTCPTRRRWSGSGRPTAGPGRRWTWAGGSRRGPTWRPSYASSSTAPPPTTSSSGTR